jgi:hypothetical protein
MKLAIMQPYFFPYIGYFQLINAVDKFVIYDDIQYTKKGWINRNRILQNNRDAYISLPLKKASDYLDVRERYLSDTWPKEQKKLLNKISNCYGKAPYYLEIYPVLERIINNDTGSLFDYLYNSIKELMVYLDITTELIISSSLNIDPVLKSQDKVISICKNLKATLYINPIGGTQLYSKSSFSKDKIDLQFLKSNDIVYSQFENDFVPWLSIIDILMFQGKKGTIPLLDSNTII